ncbi:MAG: DNA polymerase IV [Nitrospiraceae bacterium]|nr:DNA polymerase IV [Nitrospiraceae bacterium]
MAFYYTLTMGGQDGNKRILHVDMDAFFAAVELLRRPELKGRPVVVGGSGDPTKRGVVSTASYEARRFGVHSAMPLKTALKLCPQCVFLPVDYNEYARFSARIKKILLEISPLMEDVGIDEAYLDITATPGPSEEIGRAIKARVFRETGLTCSVGIAPNKLLAKIASDLRKPDGLTLVGPGDVPELIWPLSARKLPGVGPKTEELLKGLGINTIGDIAARGPEWLRERFGESFGQYLYEASMGIHESPIITEWKPKSISREETFEQDAANWQTVARALASLTRDVVSSMRQEGYAARTVTVKIRFEDFETLSRARTLKQETDDLEVFRRTAFECLGRIELAKRVRLVGVRASGLKARGESEIS